MEESGLKLEVGKRYKSKAGYIITIAGTESFPSQECEMGWPFFDTDGYFYTSNGSFYGEENCVDNLIEEYEIEPQPIAELVSVELTIDQEELPLELTQILFEIKQWGEIGNREQESKRWAILSDYARKMSEEATINKYPDNVSSTQHRDLQERRQDPIENN